MVTRWVKAFVGWGNKTDLQQGGSNDDGGSHVPRLGRGQVTDARYPERWLNDRRILRLTDRAYRAFVISLAWSVGNETDGIIEPEDLTLIPGWPQHSEDELAASGLWSVNARGWLITVFAGTQSSHDEVEAASLARLSHRTRQAKYRAKLAQKQVGADQSQPDGDVHSDVTRDVHEVTVTSQDSDRTGFVPQPVPGDVSKPPEVTNHPSQKPSVVTKSGTSPGEPDKVRGCRLPEDWSPSEKVKADLRAKYPNVILGAILEEFRDYWCAVPGQRGHKVDWDRTFRNRVREVADLPRFQRNGHAVRVARADEKAMTFQSMKTSPAEGQGQPKEIEQ